MPYLADPFGEVGPGKYKDDTGAVWYDVYPLVERSGGDCFEYASEPTCVHKKSIAEHYPVKDRHDFFAAWIHYGFEPHVDQDPVRFSRLFEYEYCPDEDHCESLSSESSESVSDDELRSNDTYSTAESESTDSFVTDTMPDLCERSVDECELDRWFDRDWHPAPGTESHIKALIEDIERKYT